MVKNGVELSGQVVVRIVIPEIMAITGKMVVKQGSKFSGGQSNGKVMPDIVAHLKVAGKVVIKEGLILTGPVVVRVVMSETLTVAVNVMVKKHLELSGPVVVK